MFPLLQCLLKWSYLKGSGTLLRIAEGIKKHTLEGWVGLPIAKLLERNKVKRLSLFGSFLAFEKRTEVCRNARCTSFFVHHYTNLFTFFKLRSFEDFFDLCVPSI